GPAGDGRARRRHRSDRGRARRPHGVPQDQRRARASPPPHRHRARAEDRAGPGRRDRARAFRHRRHGWDDAAGSGDSSRADAARVRAGAARADRQSHRPRGRRERPPLTTAPGTAAQPLRVAIIGAGPTAYYTADPLLKNPKVVVEVDLFDRLPTPYGLVRLGVAPDHQKIKFVTNAFDKIAASPRFRFFGGVEIGKDVTVADLQALYHQIVFCTGAQTDRRMGIPGEDLSGSHPATEFVAWYNGHPDYRDCSFDLSPERVAVVGVGNVAVDVVRILC